MKLIPGQKITVTPHSMGIAGEGIALLDGFVVFVDGALPGEEVVAEMIEIKKKYGKARVIDFLKQAKERITAPCPYYGRCGGCQLQHIDYQTQLELKQQRVSESLKHIGKLSHIKVAPCVPSPKEFGYRNKIQLPVLYDGSSGIQLGLYARGTHDIVPIDHCMIHCELGEQIFQKIKALPQPKKGKIRHVLVKTAVNKQEVLIVLITTGLDPHWLNQFATGLPVRGVVENINVRDDNVVLGDNFNLIKGDPYIEEEICNILFRISAHSFFQVNTEQAEALYKKIRELANLTPQTVLIDAFCGVGAFALIAAKYVKKVYGIDCVSLAIDDARYNAARNAVENATFIHGKAEKEMRNLEPANVIFINPPRKGCESELLDMLNSKTVIYMSCNPATLARDLDRLSDRYIIDNIIPYDMFPQTTHVETLVKLTKR